MDNFSLAVFIRKFVGDVTRAMGLFLSCLVLLIFSLTKSFAQSSIPMEPITSGWSYHWGDVSRNGVDWKPELADWVSIVSLDELNKPVDQNILWLKLDLPSGSWRDPHLFFSSIDLTMQVYEDSQLTYQFGEINEQGESSFAGWPWHVVPVNQSMKESSVYFRIYSDYPFIGPSGDVLIGEKADLIDRVYRHGVTGMFFVLAVAIVSLISTVLGLIKKDKGRALSTGVLSLDLAVMMFAENELSQVVWFAPLAWRYIAAFSYFLIPAILAWVVHEWYPRNKMHIVRLVFVVSIAFVVTVATLSAFTGFNFVNAYPYFDGLFIVSVMALLIFSFLGDSKPTSFHRIISFGIFALFVSLILDMLSAHGFIDWIGRAAQSGLVLFTMSLLVVYLLKDWRQQITLAVLTNTLEQQVEERTRELTESKKQLEQAARTDFLTGLMNRRAFMEMAGREVANAVRHARPLSLVLFDIDHFKDINDQYGHDIGDEVLKVMSGAAQKVCREGDLICRYGGEEFVVLLHSTTPEDARALVDRLRQVIGKLCIDTDQGTPVCITASFGLICSNLEEQSEKIRGITPEKLLHYLLVKADQAMYDVKNSGRDGVKEYML